MAVTSKELRTPHSQQRARTVARHPATSLRSVVAVVRRPVTSFLSITTLILAILAAYLIIDSAVNRGHMLLDDLRYGRPRTMHLEGFVGHAEEHGQPTHFIALNLQRQVIVLELPGGDPEQIRSLPGPYLFGADEALTPVTIGLEDLDGDGQPDLLVNADNEQVVYLNKDGNFRLPTAEEQQRLSHEQQP